MKKGEISNQTLGILLVAAIALSLIGTFVSVTKVGQQPTIKLVGYAPAADTGSALVNLTVDQVLDVNFTSAALDWGIGSVDPGEVNCTISTVAGNTASCSGFTDNTNNGLVIENIGNVNVTLNISFNTNATLFIGGTSPGYEFNWSCTEVGSCFNTTGNVACTLSTDSTDANLAPWGGETKVGAWIFANATTESDFVICPNLQYGESADEIDINLMAILPADSYTGNLTNTVTATAYMIDSQQ